MEKIGKNFVRKCLCSFFKYYTAFFPEGICKFLKENEMVSFIRLNKIKRIIYKYLLYLKERDFKHKNISLTYRGRIK